MADKEGPLAKPSQNDSEIEDPGISMVDVLQDEESLEADAKAVLGRVSVQGVKSPSGHFACLYREFELYEVFFFCY